MIRSGPPQEHRWLMVAVAVAAGAATVFAAWAASQSTVLRNPDLQEAWRPAFIATYAAAGLHLWQRRPQSLTGPRLAFLSLIYGLASLNAFANPWLFCAGRLAAATFVAGMAYMFLAYPRNEVASGDRLPLAVLGILLAAAWVVTLLCSETFPTSGALTACREPCPANPLHVIDSGTAAQIGRTGVVVATSLLLLLLVVGLIRKLRAPGPYRRYLFGPALAAVAGLAVCYATYTIVVSQREHGATVVGLVTVLCGMAVPIGLVGGQLWAVNRASGRLRRVVLDLPPSQVTQHRLQETLRETLDDQTLAFWRWDRATRAFVDTAGQPVDLSTVPAGGETPVEPEGRPPGLITHDPSLQDLAPVPEALAGTALMLLEAASLRGELRAVRGRLAATSHSERVRLERDLHDGIQPRLTTLGVRLAEARSLAGSPQLAALLDEAAQEVLEVAGYVRTLAHDLYPPALHELGLPAAIRESAAGRAGVQVRDAGIGRLTAAVEEALFYIVLEAVQNALRHAGHGAAVTVTLDRVGTDAVARIEDDGVGFERSRVRDGLGMLNMRDRAEALGGDVEVVSRSGNGTVVVVRVPASAPAEAGSREGVVEVLFEVSDRHRAAAASHRKAAEVWASRGDHDRAALERSAAEAAATRARHIRSVAREMAQGAVSPDGGEDGAAHVS